MNLRSFLVPGDSEKKFAKGAAVGADALILDLEDAVAAPAKPWRESWCGRPECSSGATHIAIVGPDKPLDDSGIDDPQPSCVPHPTGSSFRRPTVPPTCCA